MSRDVVADRRGRQAAHSPARHGHHRCPAPARRRPRALPGGAGRDRSDPQPDAAAAPSFDRRPHRGRAAAASARTSQLPPTARVSDAARSSPPTCPTRCWSPTTAASWASSPPPTWSTCSPVATRRPQRHDRSHRARRRPGHRRAGRRHGLRARGRAGIGPARRPRRGTTRTCRSAAGSSPTAPHAGTPPTRRPGASSIARWSAPGPPTPRCT